MRMRAGQGVRERDPVESVAGQRAGELA